MTNATDMMAERAKGSSSWPRLFDRLRRWIQVRGVDEETEKRLRYELEDLRVEWLQPLRDGEGPVTEIMQAFREDAELWLQAAPIDDIVVMPKAMLAMLVAAIPPARVFVEPSKDLAGAEYALPPLSADDLARMGREQVVAAAQYRHRARDPLGSYVLWGTKAVDPRLAERLRGEQA